MGTILHESRLTLLNEVGLGLRIAGLNNGFRLSSRISLLWCFLVDCQRRYAERRHLVELDAHVLADMGMSRADALAEAQKPAWRP